jgi:hypothetical protein
MSRIVKNHDEYQILTDEFVKYFSSENEQSTTTKQLPEEVAVTSSMDSECSSLTESDGWQIKQKRK